MSLSADHSRVQYELMTANDNGHQTDNKTLIKWLNGINMCLFCVVRSPTGKHRSKCYALMLYSLNALIICSCSVELGYTTYNIYKSYDSEGDLLFIVFVLWVYTFVALRMTIQFYMLCKFNYPWYYKLHLESEEIKTSRIYISVIIGIILLELLSGIVLIWPDSGDWTGIVTNLLFDATVFIILWFSTFWILAIQSAIAYKYHRCLSIISAKQNVMRVLDIYKEIYKEFGSDMPLILKICIQWKVVPLVFFLWTTAYRAYAGSDHVTLIFSDYAGILLDALSTVSAVVVSGCFLNEKADEFNSLLWEKFELEKDKEQLYLLSAVIVYVKEHPIQFTFAGLRITKKNTVVFILGFIASRFAAKLVTYFFY